MKTENELKIESPREKDFLHVLYKNFKDNIKISNPTGINLYLGMTAQLQEELHGELGRELDMEAKRKLK